MEFLNSEILAEVVTPAGDFEAIAENMPKVSAEIVNVKWGRAEPDVGIMTDYVDDYDLECHFGTGTRMRSLQILASLVKAELGSNITEDATQLYAKLNELEEAAVEKVAEDR